MCVNCCCLLSRLCRHEVKVVAPFTGPFTLQTSLRVRPLCDPGKKRLPLSHFTTQHARPHTTLGRSGNIYAHSQRFPSYLNSFGIITHNRTVVLKLHGLGCCILRETPTTTIHFDLNESKIPYIMQGCKLTREGQQPMRCFVV